MNEESMDGLLKTWEETYKKGLLSFWILLLLHERPSYPYEMSQIINDISEETIHVDDNSIYRALNRFEGIGLVTSELSNTGTFPQRRYYSLSDKGLFLLREFIQRNILVFETPSVAERIQSVLVEKS
jgi:PadR family transcriptional regulator, regulatory protein PadR